MLVHNSIAGHVRATTATLNVSSCCNSRTPSTLFQIRYMRGVLDPSELQRRMELYVHDQESAERLPRRCFVVLRQALLAGELERGRIPQLIDTSERAARRVASALIDKRPLVARSCKSPLRLGCPIDVVERGVPNLYPVMGWPRPPNRLSPSASVAVGSIGVPVASSASALPGHSRRSMASPAMIHRERRTVPYGFS